MLNDKIVIGFVGAPSTGKTTLARAVASVVPVDFVSEYAREYIQQHGNILHPYEQLLIFEEQARREDVAAQRSSRKVLIAETPTFVGHVYSIDLIGNRKDRDHAKRRECVVLSERWVYERLPVYDMVFYVPIEDAVPFVEDGVRNQHGGEWRVRLDQALLGFLHLYGVPYIKCTGTLSERIKTVSDWLEKRIAR